MEFELARKIVISADSYEARAALLDGDLLINLEIESAGSNRKKGNIYRGRVTTIEKGLDAAFVDYGTGKEGFLPLDEVNERSLIELTGKSVAANGHVSLGVGDTVLVQVAKEEVGKKGAALTMNISSPGRFLVLMPFSSRTGVSRRLAGDDRTRLKDALDRLSLPEGFGLIIRTASDQSMEKELQADLNHLLSQWKDILSRFNQAKKPTEVHTESSLALRFIRDYMDAGVSEVIVEDQGTWQELNGYFASVMPGWQSILSRYTGDLPLFVKFNVDRQVEALLKNKVILPSGGSIVIGQTEALTAIDVNSGRTKKGAIEDTAFKTNLEAAVEIARQVILRDIGGIIVVDFIDMESEAHRKGVEDALRNALARDKAHLTVARIRDFGLLAFSRQRLRHTVEEGIMSACPACGGTGRIRAPGPLAMSIMRRLRERLANMTSEAELVEVTVSVDVANFLNNRKRDELIALEKKHGLAIEILGTTDVAAEDMQIRIHEDIPDDRQLARARIEGHEEPAAAAPAATKDAQQPAVAAGQPASPPKQKPSLLKGLIAKLLDLDEFDEVQTRGKGKGESQPPATAKPTVSTTSGRDPISTASPSGSSAGAIPSAATEVNAPATGPQAGNRRNQSERRKDDSTAGADAEDNQQAKPREGRSHRSRSSRGRGQKPAQQQDQSATAQDPSTAPARDGRKASDAKRQPAPAADVTRATSTTASGNGGQSRQGQVTPDGSTAPAVDGEQPARSKRSRSRRRRSSQKSPADQGTATTTLPTGSSQAGAAPTSAGSVTAPVVNTLASVGEGSRSPAERRESDGGDAQGAPDKPKAPRKRYRSRKPKTGNAEGRGPNPPDGGQGQK